MKRSLLEQVFELSNQSSSKRSMPFSSQPTNFTIGNASTISKGRKPKNIRAGKTKGLAKYIKAVVRGSAEKKEVLTSLATTLNATLSNVILLNGVAEGTDYNQRVGREVTHAYLEINLGLFCQSGTANPVGDFGFWAIVLDRQPSGSLPAFNTIFDDSLGVGAGTDFRITSTNQDRFKIISRNEWAVGCAGVYVASVTSGTGAVPYHVKEYIDLSKLGGKDQTGNYSLSTGVIGAIDSGALYFVVASTNTNGQLNTTVIGQAKYRFTDI